MVMPCVTNLKHADDNVLGNASCRWNLVVPGGVKLWLPLGVVGHILL